MKTPRRSLPLLLCATLSLSLCALAQAQPDPDNAPKATNPENRARPTREQREAQREAQRAEQRQRLMTRQLERVGVTEKTQQEAVIQYIEGETEARQELQEKSRALSTGMRTDAITDTQVAILLNDYHVAIEDYRAQRVTAQKKLGESVNLLEVPRLEAFLTLMGYYGDAPSGGDNWMGRRR